MGRRGLDIEIDAEELAQRLTPRDDTLVLEAPPSGDHTGQPSGTATFEAIDGPYRSYQRVATWEPTEGEGDAAGTGDAEGATSKRFRYRQYVKFWPAIPVFAGWFHPLMRKALVDGPPEGRSPMWATPDRLSPHQSTALAAMCLIHVVGGMLYAFLTNVLTFAAADLGNGTAGEQSVILAVSRVGTILTIVVMTFADRVGRRRVALWSAAVSVALTLATALAPSLLVIGALQTVTRNLAIASMLAADTITVEELPPRSRAAAQGLGALSYGLGAGFVVLALPLADLGASGWRLVLAVAVVGIPLIIVAARHLPESRRFLSHDRSVAATRLSRTRLLYVGALLFLLNFFVAPSSQLQNDYLRADRMFDGSRITLFIIVTTFPGLFGILLGGRLADTRGRRAALVPGLLGFATFGAFFFVVDGAAMWAMALVAAGLGTVAVPALGVMAPELFPTARRGTVRGGLTAVATAGSAIGLLAAGVLVDSFGYGEAFLWLAIAPLMAAIMATRAPETSGLELEDLNERLADGPDPASP